MKIDTNNGLISFTDSSIGRAMKRAEFLGTLLGRSAKTRSVGARNQYEFEPEPGISATAFFDGELLDRLFIMMRMPSDIAGQWTEALEMERKARHDIWIAQELGPGPHKYAWGSVSSDFDPRGCASEIIVVYDH